MGLISIYIISTDPKTGSKITDRNLLLKTLHCSYCVYCFMKMVWIRVFEHHKKYFDKLNLVNELTEASILIFGTSESVSYL